MFAFLFVAFVVVYVLHYYRKVSRYPAGPFPLPLIGNLYHIRPDNLQLYLHKTGEKFGHCFTLFLPRPTVFFTDYAHIKEALVDKGEHFAGRSHLPPESLLQRELQTGVLISDGEAGGEEGEEREGRLQVWRDQRRTALRILREFGLGKNLMEAQVTRSIHELLSQMKELTRGAVAVDLNTPLQLCVGNIINETLFGYHFKYDDCAHFESFIARVNKHMQNMRDNVWVLVIQGWPWTKNLPFVGRRGFHEPRENIAVYQSFIDEEIETAAASFDPHHAPSNFVHAYLAEMDKNAALERAVQSMGGGEGVQDKMRSELLTVVGAERLAEMADKPRLPYFTAAVAEIQRVANMIPFLGWHRCTEDTYVRGKLIPRDTLTLPQIHSVLANDPAFDHPDEFRPERFLEEDGKTFDKSKMERLIVFGMGKRQCIGEGLARMELFLVLAALLQNYRFEPVGPIDMDPIFGAVLTPKPYKCMAVPI